MGLIFLSSLNRSSTPGELQASLLLLGERVGGEGVCESSVGALSLQASSEEWECRKTMDSLCGHADPREQEPKGWLRCDIYFHPTEKHGPMEVRLY